MKKGVQFIAIIVLFTSCNVSRTIDAAADATVESMGSETQEEATDVPSLIGTWLMYEGTEATGDSEIMVFNSDNTMQTTSVIGHVEKGAFTYNENTGELVMVELLAGKNRNMRMKVRFDDANTARIHGAFPGEPMKGESTTENDEFNLLLKRKN